jgi:hypothetical protein
MAEGEMKGWKEKAVLVCLSDNPALPDYTFQSALNHAWVCCQQLHS